MMIEIKYVAEIPAVKGADLRFPTRKLAEREADNARKAGLQANVREIIIRPAGAR